MKLITILSSQLPEISEEVKKCINKGVWILFTTQELPRNERTEFILQTDGCLYELDTAGRVLSTRASDDAVPKINELISFSDMPSPASLSNSVNQSATSFSFQAI